MPQQCLCLLGVVIQYLPLDIWGKPQRYYWDACVIIIGCRHSKAWCAFVHLMLHTLHSARALWINKSPPHTHLSPNAFLESWIRRAAALLRLELALMSHHIIRPPPSWAVECSLRSIVARMQRWRAWNMLSRNPAWANRNDGSTNMCPSPHMCDTKKCWLTTRNSMGTTTYTFAIVLVFRCCVF